MAEPLAHRRKPAKPASPARDTRPAPSNSPSSTASFTNASASASSALLATNASLSFNDLKRILKTTDGNLSVHARKLRRSRIHFVPEIFRRPRPPHRIPPDRYRPPRPGPISRPNGGMDPPNPRPVAYDVERTLRPLPLT